jgi:DNA-binding response OmpR family regulator
LLARLFTRCGHTPVCLYNGTAVVAAMRDRPFHLVLLDVMMPEVDGFEVLRLIRAEPEPAVSRTPVAMYTAISDPAQQERGLALGANEWIVKGTPFQLLRQRPDGFLSSRDRASSNVPMTAG